MYSQGWKETRGRRSDQEGGKVESAKEKRAGMIGKKKKKDSQNEGEREGSRWTFPDGQLGMSSQPESFYCRGIEKGEVVKLYVTTEMCEHRFLLFFSPWGTT